MKTARLRTQIAVLRAKVSAHRLELATLKQHAAQPHDDPVSLKRIRVREFFIAATLVGIGLIGPRELISVSALAAIDPGTRLFTCRVVTGWLK
ncbi:protein of unknown function (plasmid) [Pararobbsia alpina]|uniref:hypothetical protein n=1 Tax=Pararobbsia alpina TaxID=621374 RepID=UPI0039A6B2E5